ncbi:c-type cytochrome [Neptuniibacter caesariensis]|uniref:Cytochrome c2 n=1 Tax=Neptuniibacter caesariensis TaxID=207954 RepID=A0A7U8GS34_NEPCE|nr:c-type cytochrome [Neptuniibacter caesariensis]EAR60898.1 cytochrome c2 [Oceanospirillum sp. MED92] [Neptuniibacter caesariensis]
MKTIITSALVLGLSLSFSVSAVADDDAMMQAAGKELFNKCSACHSLDSSKNAFGPDLSGVVGRKAASLPRFAYSEALQKSDITWTEANLRKWIAGNDQFVPGTRMRHVEITDKAEQDYLIAYLKTL